MMKAMQAKNNETMKTHDENHVKSNDTMTHDEQEEAYVKKNEHMMSNDENRVTRGENMVKYGEHNEKHLRNESMKNMVENGRFLARLHSHIVFHVFLLTRSLEKVF